MGLLIVGLLTLYPLLLKFIMPFGAHCRSLALVFDLKNEHVSLIDPDAQAGPAVPSKKLNYMVKKEETLNIFY